MAGRYVTLPDAVKRVWIPKPGSTEQRPLGIPTVRDRVVQAALRLVLEPIFENDFHAHSYGFRPGRSAQQAAGVVLDHLKAQRLVVVDVDLKAFSTASRTRGCWTQYADGSRMDACST
jgi:RNA-directed DNA polymerase